MCFQILETVSSSQGLYLIRCCGNFLPEELLEERNRLVNKIWALLLNLEVPLDITHYNSLLRIYLENEHSFNPLKFLSTAIERAIQPDRVYRPHYILLLSYNNKNSKHWVTYQRLLIAYWQEFRSGNWSQVALISCGGNNNNNNNNQRLRKLLD